MMKRVLALGLCMSLLSAAAPAAEQAFAWPGGARAAVGLSYDDALASQLDHAIPALNRYQLKGTFYLQLSSPVIGSRLAEWRAAAAAGHELGNHTLFHHCSRSKPGREWVEPHRDLDKLSVAQLKDQILLANVMLQAIDGRSERTFTTPCGDLEAGGVNYLGAVRDQFVGIKSAFGGVYASMRGADPLAIMVNTPTDVTGAQLIALVEEAGRKGTMIHFTFHGIGGDHLAVSREAHEQLLAFLAAHRQTYWVDTFLAQARFLSLPETRAQLQN
jgi:peptidoglycan/xylan/chitin deacetylase (PgdA/CDA1 family)